MIIDRSARRQIEAFGSCTEDDWELFVTEKPAHQSKAKVICSSCPMRAACLEEFFFEAGVVVGGRTWAERKQMIHSGDAPPLVWSRLVESLTIGGVRGIILNTNLSEREAVQITRTLDKRSA